jgi:Arc/MetJ-type ribon-helix-helix transcriptional regulator
MRRITVTLDVETARWARIEARRRRVSVSSLVREALREHMADRQSYVAAMERYLGRASRKLGGSLPIRDELNDRR